MESIGYGRFSGSAFDPTPNVLIDLAKASQGQRDALALQQAAQQNDLLRFKMEAEQAALSRDASFRALAPNLMQGNADAYQSALGIDPERAAKLRAAFEGFGDDQRKRALQNLELMGQGAASLLALTEDQAAAGYGPMLERLKAAGIDTSSLPTAYPGPAALEQFSRMLVPVQQTLAQLAARPRAAGQSWLDRIKADESGGDPNARNPLSSAAGAGQFINSTWQQFAQANPQLFQGMTPEQVLAARSNPELMDRAIMWYRGVNERQLSQAGIDPTDANLALAHRFGGGGAAAIVRAKEANPATPMSAVVTPEVLRANPDLASRTVGDVVAATERRYQPRPMTDANGMPIVRGDLVLTQGADGAPVWKVNQEAIKARTDVLDERARLEAERLRLKSELEKAKPLPTAIAKLEDEDANALSTATTALAQITELNRQLQDGGFKTDLLNRGIYALGAATGLSGPEGRNLASFEAARENLANAILMANKGVQTDKDAQRAVKELKLDVPDVETIKKRLTELTSITEKGIEDRLKKMNERRVQYGKAPLKLSDLVAERPITQDARQPPGTPSGPSQQPGAPRASVPQPGGITARNEKGERIRYNPQTRQWEPM
jgi:hypothetical protein